MAEVRINLSPLRRRVKVPREVFQKWADRWKKFSQERFNRLSKGGGEWKQLSPRTIVERFHRKKFKRTVTSILFESGTLFKVLEPGKRRRGGTLKFKRRGGQIRSVRVGYGGTAKHPLSKSKSIAVIARKHQKGDRRARLPRRRIVVAPPRKVVRMMARDVVDYQRSLG